MAHRRAVKSEKLHGLSTPTLLEQLQAILRHYSDGQILKELLQNAEDAGATEIRFLYDENHYGTKSLLQDDLADFQGPALCSYNDAVFKDEDWEGIQRIARSGKKEDVLKVGRFGIGFSSVYHLTDLPCIISKDILAMIDPHEKYFYRDARKTSSCGWRLESVIEEYKDQLRPFQAALPPGVHFQEQHFLSGTLFRFPLRKQPNSLSRSVFTPEKTHDLLEAFQADARIVLLFLRNIEKVHIDLRPINSRQTKYVLGVSFDPLSIAELRDKRQAFSHSVRKFKETSSSSHDIDMSNTFDLHTECVDLNTGHSDISKETWVVCQKVALKCSPKLAFLYKELKFLPWVGVAVPLFGELETTKGRTFCFLPLPPGEESLSGLPVHVHGFFAVSDDRRSLKWPSCDQIQNKEAEWNKMLVDEVLPQVYLKALLEAINVALQQNLKPSIVYKAVPDISQKLGHWKDAVVTLLTNLFGHRVLYCRAKNEWKGINEVILMTQHLPITSKRSKVIVKCLQKSGLHVIEDLPGHMRTAIKKYGQGAKSISPGLVISCLRNQAIGQYSAEERLHLLDYLLEKRSNSNDLDGLQLLPTEAGTFVPFRQNPRDHDVIFKGTLSCPQDLLPSLEHRFMKTVVGKKFSKLRQSLDSMFTSENWKQLQFLDVGNVVRLLPETLPKSWCQENDSHVLWNPNLEGQPDLQWLKNVWMFACQHEIDLDDFRRLKILPVSNINTVPIQMMALKENSKVVNVDKADKTSPHVSETITVLQRLEIKVCELPKFVSKHYQISISNSTFVHSFHADGVLQAVKSVGASKLEKECSANRETRELFCFHLLPFLSSKWFSESDKQFLRRLSVFKAFQNKKTLSQTLVSLSSGVSILQKKDLSRLPPIALQRKYLLVESSELLYFLSKLDVSPKPFEEVFTGILRDCQQGRYARSEIFVLSKWIRLNYDMISSVRGVKDLLKDISFVPDGNNELKRPRDLFDVSDHFVNAFIQNKSLLISEDNAWIRWLPTLRVLGLKNQTNITPNDVKNAASGIAFQKDVPRANVLAEYLCKYPECLQNKSLCMALIDTAFLVCESTPSALYPKSLPFNGKNGLLYKPKEMVVYSEKMCCLVGASTPMVSNISSSTVLNALQIRREPRIREVLNQLNHCVSLKNQSAIEWGMLRYIYQFLNVNVRSFEEDILKELPQKWLFVGDRFMDAKSVYREEGVGGIVLTPFLCVLPKEYRKFNDLLRAAGVSDHVTKDVSFLVGVLEKIKTAIGSIGMDVCLRVTINILRELIEFEDEIEDENIRCRLYVPTSCTSMKLLPPDEVCYDDTSYDNDGQDFLMDEDEPPIYLVHSEVPSYMARKLGVMSLSKRLAGADEIGGIMQSGQYEPITDRLKSLLKHGYQPESIPKEMVQNAEDAGASEVKFLLDLRGNKKAIKGLLDPAMREVQGPALWIYNDAAFTEEDLHNITKLGGATKSEDQSKIGQFGLGFNAVYHITDVPSFVTNDYITIFDPHKTHLQNHIRGERTGIQINFVSNRRLARFQDQFLPYEGVFGCRILSKESRPERYNHTLFRLPLRNENEAKRSDICSQSYNEEKMKNLLKSLCDTASKMLIFTENVKTISVHLLQEGEVSNMVLLYKVTKNTKSAHETNVPFRNAVYSSVKACDSSILPKERRSLVICKCQWTERGMKYFSVNNNQRTTNEEWVVVMSGGNGGTFKLCLKDGVRSGMLPCGGVAWNPNVTIGGVFCFLPLSVPQSGLPICINGCFAVSTDRRSIWRESESDLVSQTAAFKTKWNQYVLEDIIVSAYINLLQEETVQEYANRRRDPYSLWPSPLKTPRNSDYGKVMTGFYKTLLCGVEGKTPPKVFCKADEIYSIDEISFVVESIQNDDRMFPIIERVFRQITSKEVVKIPPWIKIGFQEAGYFSQISRMTYSLDRFFREIFLPNLTQLQEEDVTNLLLKALSIHDDAVLASMRVSECIPAKTMHGKMYKIPSSLLDPAVFEDVFFKDEGVFPDDHFLKALNKHQEETLRELDCLKNDIKWEDVLERAKTVGRVWNVNREEAVLRVKALLKFMDYKLRHHPSGYQNTENNLREVAFLPAERDGEVEIQCPNNVYLAEETNLVGYVCHILDTSKTGGTLEEPVSRLLGMHGKKVKAEDVMKNLCRLKEMNVKELDSNSLQKQCDSIYLFLQQHLKEKDVLHFLQRETVFCLHQEFQETKRLAFFSDSFPPYLIRVPDDWKSKFSSLLEAAGVKHFFDCNDLIGTLNFIKEEKKGEPLDEDMLSSILTKLIIPLYKVADEVPAEQLSQIPLPDSEHTLQFSGDLSYCDLDTFQHLTSKYKLCHREISSLHAKKLGVRDIRDQMLRNYSQSLPGYGGIGESFGQREELVTRITRIMEGYPCDFSILKELVQNADDANATKVHFVLDTREHPTDRLFYNSMSELQGPALLAYNNKPFTDDDIEGIQRLGEGSKSDESDKTGRYGVGFNVVYHLTDCPMFLSGGNTLCIFDPTLRYIPDADLLCPGRMFRPIDRAMLHAYSDLFNSFFSFEKDFKLDDGTLFRFPLRQKNSQISSKISPSHIEKLFEDFKVELFDILLFLKNVEEISLSICTNGSLDKTYTVTSVLPLEEGIKRQQFFQRMTKQKERTLFEISVSDLQYKVLIKDNEGRLEEWLVHQRLGIANKDMIPDSVKHANTVTKLKLLPKGGVAAMIMGSKSRRKVKNRIEGKAFCFLPLPIQTNLPVHVDGYFALGHEARRNLWEAPVGEPKGDWNRLISNEIIARVYVLILEKIKADITESVSMDMEKQDVKEKLYHYHSLFPLHFKVGKMTSLNAWDELGKKFYQIVLGKKCTIFPVMYSKYVRIAPVQSCPVGSDRTNVELAWKSCVANADEEGYFDDLHLQIPKQETGERDKEKPKFLQLKHLLLDLGFPLMETPMAIYIIMEKVILSIENEAPILLKVNPQSVETWLKTVAKCTTLQGLPMQLKETRITSNRNLQLLVEYIAKVPELKLCGLPLLLTNDGVLNEFSLTRKVFHSRYYSLLPKCAGEFLHSQFLSMFQERDECFAQLELSDLVDRLPTYLPPSQYCTGEYTLWNQDPRNKLRTPRADWVKKLWKFLFESRKKPDWEANVVQALRNWSILPVQCENEAVKYLAPMNLAKTVLSRDISRYHVEMGKILKCLQCPIVDTTTFEEMGAVSLAFYQPTFDELCQFVMSFTTNLDNAENTLLVFERLIECKLHRFEMLEKANHRFILNYFSKKASLLARNGRNLMILKSLPCFETIHGDFVALSGKGVYAVVIENVPKCDQETWISRSGSVFLKHYSEFAELFNFLEVIELSDVELYRRFILPCFTQFSILAQWEHLTKIIDMIRTNLQPEEIISTLNLKNERVVPQENGIPRLGSSFCDEENPVFKEMLEKRYFPPNHPYKGYQTHWLRFLRQIGLQSDVSYVQFEEFARTLSQEDKNTTREKILVDYFFENHHLHSDRNFLSRLADIPFISPADTPDILRELHEPCFKKKVTLTAVPEEHQKLVWTIEAVLPSWVYFRRCEKCIENGASDTALPKTKEPSLNHVFSHTQTLCCYLAKLHESPLPLSNQDALIKHGKVLNEVVIDVLKFLSGRCEKAGKCDTCSDKRNCCSTCGRIIKALEDIPVIPLKSGSLVKAKRLTKNLPKRENDKLFLFLNKLPDQFIPYCNLLYCLGTTEEPSLIQYASTLKLIKQQSLSDQHNNPNILKAAEQAVECFFRVLAEEENAQLDGIEELFLLTNKKESPLLKSTELFYNDEPSYEHRLKYFPHALMRTVKESQLKTYVNLDQLVERLQHLRPKLISEAVEEILTISDKSSKPKSDCRCSFSQHLAKVFSWRSFFLALKIILKNENKTDDREHGEVFETNFSVQCLDEIPTELRMKDGTVIPQSQVDAGVLFRRRDAHEVDVIISHDANDALIQIQIADGFNHFFGNFLKDTKFLVVVLNSKSNDKVIPNLSVLGLKTTSDELQALMANPVLGSEIENDIICLLMQDPFCHFSPNEYVGYNDTHGEDEHLVHAKIIRKSDTNTDISNEQPFKVKYIIEIGKKQQIEVEALWLYRFMRPRDEPPEIENDKTHIYNPEGPPSSCTDVAVFEGDPNPNESRENSEDFEDLEKTKRKITKIIEDIWKEEDSVRRAAIRRLQRKWHPDKHKAEHKKFAEEVFKHIRREIERMEKGIPSGVDSDDDIFRWAQRNTAEQSQYWRFHRRWYGGRRRRSRGSGFEFWGGGWNTSSSSTGFKAPPSFHKINLEACRWMKQARIDMEAAAAVGNEEKHYFQWKSSLCFFAVEKSVRAAQLVCGCGMSEKHNLMDASLKLKRHLDVTEAIQKLLLIVGKDSHYPSTEDGTSIPHEKFDREKADEAMNIAERVLAKVDHYVNFG